MRRPVFFLLALGLLSALSLAASAQVDVSAIDTHANPCADFYQYACGNWMATHPIPADQSRWGSFGALGVRNHEVLRQILEQAAAAPATPVAQQVGDYYAACMNTAAIDRAGAAPLQPELERIAALRSKTGLAAVVAAMHVAGEPALFRFGSGPDARDSNSDIASADQAGITLARDYYTKNDPHTVAIRRAYVAHMGTIFELLGEPVARAAGDARAVLQIETALANGSLTNVERRNPQLTYNKMDLAKFEGLAPDFAWATYFRDVHAPAFSTLNVGAPGYFRALNAELAAVPLSGWQAYLRWQTVHAAAPSLSQPFVDADFAFFDHTLRGTLKNQPRWFRCSASTDRGLGEALGQLYVQKAFGGNAKAQMLTMVRELETALGKDIESLAWMSPATKQQAVDKLDHISNMIAYPDKWRDYSSVRVARGDFLGNQHRVAAFNWARAMNDLGKPTDKSRFNMTPPTVNANYTAARNTITFPAGILQPPFYDPHRDLASNFGGIGVVIGHEMSHGFDDHGRQYDGAGNLRDWWTKADGAAFQQRADCLVAQYARYSPVAGTHLNGRLTLGENGADNAGARIAYMAMEAALTPRDRQKVDGYSPEQRFFLAFARVFCENVRPASAEASAKTDPHSPGKFRVLGVVTNMPEFAQAFHCGPADPMSAKVQSCRVW